MACIADVKAALLARAATRGPNKSFCPSETARELWPGDWRDHMDEVRAAAAQLVSAGELACTQGGAPADPVTTPGPIRLSQA